MALHAQHFPSEFKANDCSYLRDAAFITETRAACCAAEDTCGLVVTPIWPAMLDCDLPDPDAAAMTCWRDECCAAALTLELFAAPRWPATCWRFIFDAEEIEEEAAFCTSNRRALARCAPRNLECCLQLLQSTLLSARIAPRSRGVTPIGDGLHDDAGHPDHKCTWWGQPHLQEIKAASVFSSSFRNRQVLVLAFFCALNCYHL